MGRKLSVNWTELHDLGKRTKKNVNELENIRTNLYNIVNSLSSCWQGADASNYISNASSYLNMMKEDVDFLEQWANAFDRSASLYNGSVDDCTNYVKGTRRTFDEENLNGGVNYE